MFPALRPHALLVLALASAASAAGVVDSGGIGDLSEYVRCSGLAQDGARLSFKIRGTAIPTFKQGVLKLGEGEFVSMKCDDKSQDLVSDAPSAGQLEWECSQLGQTDGGYVVRVVRQGFSGFLEARVLSRQAFPLGPQVLATLSCQEPSNPDSAEFDY